MFELKEFGWLRLKITAESLVTILALIKALFFVYAFLDLLTDSIFLHQRIAG